MKSKSGVEKHDFMGAPSIRSGHEKHLEYFQNYRDENISRMQVPPYDWGGMNTPYTPNPDVSVYKNSYKHLYLPPSQFTMIDREHHQEVDDFYVACQLHRDQYKDQSGSLHPLEYFKKSDYLYQCSPDPTTRYLKYPDYHVKYKQPIVLPLSLERTLKTPLLPDRALTGVYNPSSDISYKR